jgi:uncharacterized coiled-coil protein SlyX
VPGFQPEPAGVVFVLTLNSGHGSLLVSLTRPGPGVVHSGCVDFGAVSAVVAVAGLALTIVALFASWRVSKNAVSGQVYRDTALAWEAKSTQQSQEITDLNAKLAQRDQQLAELRGKVDFMQDALTGRKSWEVLEARMAEVLGQLGDIRGDLRTLLGQLGDLRGGSR